MALLDFACLYALVAIVTWECSWDHRFLDTRGWPRAVRALFWPVTWVVVAVAIATDWIREDASR